MIFFKPTCVTLRDVVDYLKVFDHRIPGFFREKIRTKDEECWILSLRYVQVDLSSCKVILKRTVLGFTRELSKLKTVAFCVEFIRSLSYVIQDIAIKTALNGV